MSAACWAIPMPPVARLKAIIDLMNEETVDGTQADGQSAVCATG